MDPDDAFYLAFGKIVFNGVFLGDLMSVSEHPLFG